MASWQKIARQIRVPLGFLFAAAYLWLAHPAVWSLIAGSCLAAIGLWIRAIASGHVRKNEELAMSGPYAYTRNPLYLGSLVIALGFVIASRSWIIAVIAAGFFLAIYIPVIRGEEEFLRGKFPNFDEYARNVPRLFPRLRPYESTSGSFDQHLYWKHREYNAAIGAACILTALIVKILLRG